MWGTPLTEEDIMQVFIKFLDGTINRLPWFEDQGMQAETLMIKNVLVKMNEKKLFTINSQPKLNCVSATDPKLGWGPRGLRKGGYIFQREYIEFFCSKERLDVIIEVLNKYPTVAYVAVNNQGETISNIEEGEIVAMTWGIFPNKEIIQPTILDPYIFKTWWKEEAFSVWTQEWGVLYEKTSETYGLLEKIANTYYLVNVHENDFVEGDLDSVFEEIISRL